MGFSPSVRNKFRKSLFLMWILNFDPLVIYGNASLFYLHKDSENIILINLI